MMWLLYLVTIGLWFNVLILCWCGCGLMVAGVVGIFRARFGVY